MTRRDAQEFLDVAAAARVRVETAIYPLDAANDALLAIKSDAVRGAAVLQVRE
jgi:propanol-preferring alcohol dehydrogenase